MTKLRAIVKGPTGDEASRAADALAEAQRQRQAAREALAKAESERTAAMRDALDGEVDVATLERHRGAITQERLRLEEAEQLVAVLREKHQRAEHNATVRKRAETFASYKAEIEALTADVAQSAASVESMVTSHRRAVQRIVAIRKLAKELGIDRLPPLWEPMRLVRTIELDIVRLEPRYWKYHQASLANTMPTLMQQHQAAVDYALPPAPTPKPVAA